MERGIPMLTKEKAMYQTWLIIEGLSAKERNMISKDLLQNMALCQ